MSFEARKDVAAKVDWEGGLFEAVDYGIRASDMPVGDSELIRAWQELEDAFSEYVRKEAVVEELLDLLE